MVPFPLGHLAQAVDVGEGFAEVRETVLLFQPLLAGQGPAFQFADLAVQLLSLQRRSARLAHHFHLACQCSRFAKRCALNGWHRHCLTPHAAVAPLFGYSRQRRRRITCNPTPT